MDSGTARARVRASNGVHVPVVAALVAAAWAAPQEDELAERQESVPGVVLPAAWVSGLESRPFNNSTERHCVCSLPAKRQRRAPLGSTDFWRFLCHAGGTMSWTVLTVGLVLIGLVAALALIPVLISQNPPEQPDDDDIAGMQ